MHRAGTSPLPIGIESRLTEMRRWFPNEASIVQGKTSTYGFPFEFPLLSGTRLLFLRLTRIRRASILRWCLRLALLSRTCLYGEGWRWRSEADGSYVVYHQMRIRHVLELS